MKRIYSNNWAKSGFEVAKMIDGILIKQRLQMVIAGCTL